MDAITLNWLWYSATFGALAFLMLRWFRLSPGHGDRRGDEALPSMPAGDGGSRLVPGPPPGRPVTTLDPVSGEPLRMIKAMAYFHRGKVYFFASEQTRIRFEASPRTFAPEPTLETHQTIDAGKRRPPNSSRTAKVGSSDAACPIEHAQVEGDP